MSVSRGGLLGVCVSMVAKEEKEEEAEEEEEEEDEEEEEGELVVIITITIVVVVVVAVEVRPPTQSQPTRNPESVTTKPWVGGMSDKALK